MGKGKIWANKWSGARLFRLEEVKFFCTFELFSQGLPLPPTQETNTETGLLQRGLQWLKASPGKARRNRGEGWGPGCTGGAGSEELGGPGGELPGKTEGRRAEAEKRGKERRTQRKQILGHLKPE